MSSIKSIEQTFPNLDAKIASITTKIVIETEQNKNLILKLFNSFQKKEYKNGLNKSRDELLKKLISKRDLQLSKINEFIRENKVQDKYNSWVQLKILAESTRLNFIGFSRSLISIYESILLRAKLKSQSSFCSSLKYSIFRPVEKKLSISVLEKSYNIKSYRNLSRLSSDLIFFTFDASVGENVADFCMVVLKQNGDVVKLIKLESIKFNREPQVLVKLNSTNIIVFDKKEILAKIYSLKLELVYFFNLDENYNDFNLSGYEMFFINDKRLILSVYNYKTKNGQRKNIKLDRSVFFKGKDIFTNIFALNYKINLLALDERFILFELSNEEKLETEMFVFRKCDCSFVYKFANADNMSLFWFVYESELFLLKHKDNTKFQVYGVGETGLNELGTVVFKQRMIIFLLIYFMSFNGKICKYLNDKEFIRLDNLF